MTSVPCLCLSLFQKGKWVADPLESEEFCSELLQSNLLYFLQQLLELVPPSHAVSTLGLTGPWFLAVDLKFPLIEYLKQHRGVSSTTKCMRLLPVHKSTYLEMICLDLMCIGTSQVLGSTHWLWPAKLQHRIMIYLNKEIIICFYIICIGILVNDIFNTMLISILIN